MSALRKILTDDGELNLEEIPRVISNYQKRIKDWKSDLSLKDKNVVDAMIDQDSIAAYYDEIKAELNTFRSYLEVLMKKRAGEINVQFKEYSDFDHSDRSVDKLIHKDSEYIKYARLYIEVDEIYNKVRYICHRFDQRGYTLTNIREMLKAELRDITLTKEYD